jgi:hypothetical protein
MNPETVSSGSSEYTTDEVVNTPALEGNSTDANLALPPAKSSAQSSNSQWTQYGEQVAAFLQGLPGYVTRFFQDNRGPLGTIGLIVLAVIALRLTLALVDAMNDIPLVAPTLELIGIGYTGWFVYRYLLTAASRRELGEEINNLKQQVLGTGNQDT